MPCDRKAFSMNESSDEAPAPKAKDDAAQPIWYCLHCTIYHTHQVLKCTGCSREKDGGDAVAAKPANARAETLNVWLKPEDGSTVAAPTDPEVEKEQKKLEAGISAMKALGDEAKAKELEDKLKSVLQKKSAVQSPVKACMSVSKSLNDAMEKAARQVAQAEQKLEKVISVKTDLEKKQIAQKKSLKEEYEEKARVSQLAYDKEKLRLDEEERQERLKLEEVKKVTTADVAQKQLAMGNVAAVASGSQQRGGAGQQSAGVAAAPGAVLVQTAPGYIVHANDMSTEELALHLLQDPSCAGMTPEMAAAVAASQMRFCQAKSTVVVAVPTDAQPKTGEDAEDKADAENGMDAEEEPLTSDDEENEQRLANSKEGESVEKTKISKSAKAAKKAKAGKSAGASSAASPVVKATIGRQSS